MVRKPSKEGQEAAPAGKKTPKVRTGPFCGALKKDGNFCKQPAGWQTGHPGTGKCKWHGGRAGRKPKNLTDSRMGGRYGNIRRSRIRELLKQFADDKDPLNLLPEVELLRAIMVDWMERYDEHSEGLQRWHASFSREYLKALELYGKRCAQIALGETDEVDYPPPPDPMDFVNKPVMVPDITTVAGLADKVGSMVERIDKQRKESIITLDTLNKVLEQVGVELAFAVGQEVADEALRQRILATFERRWREAPVTLSPVSSGRHRESLGPN